MKKVVAKFEIIVYSDGNVEVSGPIKNYPFYFDATNKADRAVLEMWRNEMTGASQILQVKPHLVVPK